VKEETLQRVGLYIDTIIGSLPEDLQAVLHHHWARQRDSWSRKGCGQLQLRLERKVLPWSSQRDLTWSLPTAMYGLEHVGRSCSGNGELCALFSAQSCSEELD